MADSLHKAYAYIDAGDLPLAFDALESLVGDEPANIEAWEAYMQLSESCDELDRLCERALQVSGINRVDRESLLDYYYFLRQRLKSRCDCNELHKTITLELVDQFAFTLKDRSHVSGGMAKDLSLTRGLVWFLKKIIVLPYAVLLIIGLNLLSRGNDFSYWIFAVLALSVIFASVRKTIFPAEEASCKNSVQKYLNAISACSDEISYHPELIR